MSATEIVDLKNDLRGSISVLSTMKLHESAKWSAELLNGMKEEEDDSNVDSESDEHLSYEPKYKLLLLEQDRDKVLLAMSYFDCKEYDRCAHLLKHCESPDAIFIRLYSMLLSGDKKKEEEAEGVLGPGDAKTVNMAIPLILKELEGHNWKNPFLNYLHGVVLMRQKSIKAAQEAFVKSLIQYPFNWSCWRELLLCVPSFVEGLEVLQSLKEQFEGMFSENIMLNFARVVLNQECFQQNEEIYSMVEYLLDLFPNFSFLKTQQALISYYAMDYPNAEKMFDGILVNDPLRLDEMDLFSNLLYVMNKKAKLAFLAQFAASIDKFRPETCCIIANYYSIKYEHEKAIMYYRRALTLDRNSLSAWTLMGHEFIELKNTHAAIESYRRAVDTNPKDFKAWYGLGQAYEILDMHHYSKYYYERASSLNPMDQRGWQALGNCYEKLGKFKNSIKAYKNALQYLNDDPREVSVLYKLALLYERLEQLEKCYDFMRQCLQREVDDGVQVDETAKARLWLAKYEVMNENWEAAHNYAADLNHGTGQEIEEARAIARETRSRLNLQ